MEMTSLQVRVHQVNQIFGEFRRPSNSRRTILFGMVCSIVLTGALFAQTGVGLPAAPALRLADTPQFAQNALHPLPFALPAVSLTEITVADVEDGAGDPGAADRQTEPAPVLSMAPHSEKTRYWISGQANSIFQMHGHFHSPYEGTNSLIDDFETKASEVATFYLGYQLRPNTRFNTDLIVDFENAGGRGISQALGLAGETNLDVVRNPSLSTSPYLARGEIHLTLGLTDEMTDQERGPLELATQAPVRRFEIRVGKMTLPDTFDVNSVGSDSHLQFTNWTIDNNGAWDYAADTRGYTVGGILEYDDRIWSARYGDCRHADRGEQHRPRLGLQPRQWAKLGVRIAQGAFRSAAEPETRGRGSRSQLCEPCAHGRLPPVGAAVSLGPDCHARHYQTERFGAVKYGFGLNTEQEVTDSLRLFGRFGWNEDQHESFVYTEVGQTILFGGDYAGQSWHRLNDKVGVAFVSNAIKRDHQNYLRYGGLGFLLGDGNLNYGREDIVEWYYNAHLWRGFYSAGGRHIH